jgi:uncharacterized glyoxalase superfamily protein PhnB
MTPSNPPPGYHVVSPYLLYEEAPRAIEYLTRVFGFRERLTQTGGEGRAHTELVIGKDGLVLLGQAWDGYRSPYALGYHPSFLVHVYIDDVEELHEQVERSGGRPGDLELSPAGDRRFTAVDPEGQVWVFAERVVDEGSGTG